MLTQPKTNQPAYLLAGVLFTVIALIALVSLFILRSKADVTTQEASADNTAPTVDLLTVSDSSQGASIGPAGVGAGFTTNEGSAKNIYVYGQITDLNGCHNLAGATVTLYRSGLVDDQNCAADTNNCYQDTLLPGDFVGCDTPDDTNVTFETSFSLPNYVDPSDAGSPYDAENWVAYVNVTDNAAAQTSLTETYEVNSLAAFSVPNAINYGSVALGADSNAIQLTFSNTGNRDVDSDVYAVDDMVSNLSGFDDIAASAVHYSLTSGFTYGTGDTAVAKAPSTDLALNLVQQTEDLTIPTTDTYWRLRMPASGVQGTYTNVVVFTAKAAASVAPLGQVNSENIANIKASTVESNTSYTVSSNESTGILNIYDVSQSENPISLGSTEVNSYATEISKDGNYIYLTSENTVDNMQIVDVSNTADPLIQDTITVMDNGITDIAISGNYAYVVGTDITNTKNFAIVDVTNKTAASVISGSMLNVTSTGNTAVDTISVQVISNTAYVYSTDATNGYLTTIDVTTKNAPVVISAVATNKDGVLVISADGNTAYVVGNNSDFANSVESINITNSYDMQIISGYSINNNTVTDAALVGDVLYVADASNNTTNSNLTAMDVSNSSNMSVITSTLVGTAGQTLTIAATASYVYVTAQTNATYVTLNAATIVVAGPAITTLSSEAFIIGFLPDNYVVPFNNGGSALTLVINGTGFVEGVTVKWNGGSLPVGATVTIISPTQIQVDSIPANAFTPGGAIINVIVRNPALELDSNTEQIQVIAS
ncbi:hypothetical protein HZC53_03985 [Candidatus Uhrbacteria bacterium]|nr:hypothetical protein [Candidatus Uhrbacteria bacterium]